MIEDEETIVIPITIKNEPGTSVKSGTDEVTVKPEHEQNMTTSFWSLGRGLTIKTEHPLNNQTLVKAKDEMTVKSEHKQDNRLSTSNSEDTSSGKYKSASTVWLMDNNVNQDEMIRAELEQPRYVINIVPDHGMVDQESELMVSDVRTKPILLPKEIPESSFVDQANISGKPFKCHVCGKSFTRKHYLKLHCYTHTGKKPFKCEVCGKSFTQNCQLSRHSQIHTDVYKPYKCHVCGKSFSQNANFTRHSRIHTGEKPFKCEVCGKSFTRNGDLKVHSWIHTGEKPFKCEGCGKSFTGSSHLKLHSRTHTGETPFKCEVCGKSFTHNGNLKVHSRIHMGEKPFECEVCGKSFNKKIHLKRHSMMHTSEKPFK